ncbi:MAG: hypothetical protein KQH83_06760 [Actinobacteria bacterium]|nr:hypothetical protein [Actinomycetota bacterium]
MTDGTHMHGRHTRGARRRAAVLAALLALTAACSDGAGTAATTAATDPPTTAAPGGLLAPSAAEISEVPDAARQRAVTVALDVLFDDGGAPLGSGGIEVGLFPDLTVTAVITGVADNGDGYTWTGYLDGVDMSSFTMLTTAGVFIAHFASPAGIYEVSRAGGDVYRAIEVDQSAMAGREG